MTLQAQSIDQCTYGIKLSSHCVLKTVPLLFFSNDNGVEGVRHTFVRRAIISSTPYELTYCDRP